MNVVLSKEFYPLSSFSDACAEFKNDLDFIVRDDSENLYSVEIKLLGENKKLEELINKFLNRFLEISILERLN